MNLSKGRRRLPDLRGNSNKKRGGGGFYRRVGGLPTSIGYNYKDRSSRESLAWRLLFAAVAILAAVVTAPYWLPAISLVIPDRYIMAYAPQPLQQLIFQIDPAEQIPTPVMSDPEAALALLNSAATPTPTPLPGVAGAGGYIQPTAVAVAATPTLTPVFAQAAGDPRAADRDNNADLSQADVLLTGFTWVRQGANNCGPASIATLMSYWGITITQEEAAQFLKPNPEDPNVRPDEMAAFVESYGYLAVVRVNGNIDLLKRIIAAGYPVMIETGYDPEPLTVGWTSHYLTLAGYSDEDQGFIAMDTYRRPNWFYAYEEIDRYWRQFNRRYMIVYRPDQAAAVASLVGEETNDAVMYGNAIRTAQLELSLDRSDPYGWFNLGSSLTGLGRYEEAVSAFDQARSLGLPSRFLWYQFEIFEAYLQIGGPYLDEVIALANDVLERKTSEEAFYFKGLAYLAQGNSDAARQQFGHALRFNPNYEAAREALESLDG